MADDAQLARIEERLEAFQKYIVERFANHENLDDHRFMELAEGIRSDFHAFEKLIRSSLDSVVQIHDAKAATLQAELRATAAAARAELSVAEAVNKPYRVALGILAGAFLTALAAGIMAAIMATSPVKLTPQLPPAHSTMEPKER